MPKRVQVDGRVFEVPDDATPDEIDQISRGTSAPTASQHPVLDTIKDVGRGVYQSALNLGANADKLTARIPGVGKYLTQPLSTTLGLGGPTSQQYMADEQARSVPQNTAQKVGKIVGDTAQFLVPGGAEEALLGKGAGLVARAAVKGAGAGAVNKAQGGSFTAGALTGGVGEGVAQGLKAVAPHIAEAALNVGGRDRMYGRTVGEAILNDTRGVRPATIQASAKEKIASLAPQVEQLAADASANGGRGTIRNARAVVSRTQDAHNLTRAVDSAAELDPLASRLAVDAKTGLPLAEMQTPTGLLLMKRGVNSDFITRWKPENQGLTKAAQEVYGNLAEEFHNVVPGTAELDQRMSSLFPVAERAGAASNGASITQNVLHKFRAPTGALTGAFAGGTAGYEKSHSLSGALTGAALGAVAPAVIANPTTQMTIARTLFSPKVSRYVIPAASGTLLQAGRN